MLVFSVLTYLFQSSNILKLSIKFINKGNGLHLLIMGMRLQYECKKVQKKNNFLDLSIVKINIAVML